jgi:hypothetical protein
MSIFCCCYLVKRIQTILILADEDLVWYRICTSLLESFFVIVDNSSMYVLDCSLKLQTYSKNVYTVPILCFKQSPTSRHSVSKSASYDPISMESIHFAPRC